MHKPKGDGSQVGTDYNYMAAHIQINRPRWTHTDTNMVLTPGAELECTSS